MGIGMRGVPLRYPYHLYPKKNKSVSGFSCLQTYYTRRMQMSNYYQDNLNANGLYQVYQTELPRIRQYLQAEIDYVKKALTGNEHILEIGAGYGLSLIHI